MAREPLYISVTKAETALGILTNLESRGWVTAGDSRTISEVWKGPVLHYYGDTSVARVLSIILFTEERTLRTITTASYHQAIPGEAFLADVLESYNDN